ncbi:phospholipase D-like domain-containing protein [Microvirga massiliensis]|uniref:phospholipase D-like domain-containing protein n=1 Tax=Microvirga massiliensis TaxID=1033741 RepID=UPI001FCD092B|nr:phospholipase D-like domain-containing protein [Microvirga massiliensis]
MRVEQDLSHAERVVEPDVSSAQGRRILAPGRNCWRVEESRNAAVLIDGASYFSTLEAALRRAERSIWILGWDFDGSIRLRPDVGPEESPPLGPLLRSLVEARPNLEIRILVWSLAPVHAPGDPVPLLLGTDWQQHPRLVVRLDTHHPLYAAHHQKIVCIDDSLAFAGGMDLTVRRWDTSRHAADDPVRLGANGKPCAPLHDIQMAVDGKAALAMAQLARRRWRIATGEKLGAVETRQDLWPSDLMSDFCNVPVAIARTAPAWGSEPEIREAAALTADALRAARNRIYIEAQYMTAGFVGDILCARLAGPDGPEIVVVMTHQSNGLVERLVMGSNRDRMIRRLRNADRHGRLRVFYPCVPTRDGERRQVLIHSKLIIVDDVFLRVGSSNLNNRSVGLDTECDLAIEAQDVRTRRAIANIRDRLLTEHLAVRPDDVSRASMETGSLIRAIDALNRNPRGLRAFEAMDDRGPSKPIFATRLLDPTKPFEPLWFARRVHSR